MRSSAWTCRRWDASDRSWSAPISPWPGGTTKQPNRPGPPHGPGPRPSPRKRPAPTAVATWPTGKPPRGLRRRRTARGGGTRSARRARPVTAGGQRGGAGVAWGRAGYPAAGFGGGRCLAEQLSRAARARLGARAVAGRREQRGGAPPRRTARALEALRPGAAGRSNRDIAAELFISPKTASVHVSNILAKLGVGSRGEAAAMAYRQHLLDDS